MENELASRLLASDTLDELMDFYKTNTGEQLENIGQLEKIDVTLITHFTNLLKKSHKGTPFGAQKLPDGREIYISPGISTYQKQEN